MKSSTIRTLAVAVSLALALGACKGVRENATTDETTATIAPAQPQPAETGTDAMTQTVELGDGRSVSEGAASEEGAASATTTIDTAPPATETSTTTAASTTTR